SRTLGRLCTTSLRADLPLPTFTTTSSVSVPSITPPTNSIPRRVSISSRHRRRRTSLGRPPLPTCPTTPPRRRAPPCSWGTRSASLSASLALDLACALATSVQLQHDFSPPQAALFASDLGGHERVHPNISDWA